MDPGERRRFNDEAADDEAQTDIEAASIDIQIQMVRAELALLESSSEKQIVIIASRNDTLSACMCTFSVFVSVRLFNSQVLLRRWFISSPSLPQQMHTGRNDNSHDIFVCTSMFCSLVILIHALRFTTWKSTSNGFNAHRLTARNSTQPRQRSPWP